MVWVTAGNGHTVMKLANALCVEAMISMKGVRWHPGMRKNTTIHGTLTFPPPSTQQKMGQSTQKNGSDWRRGLAARQG